MVVDEPAALTASGGARIHRGDLALPFRVQDIPIGGQGRRFHHVCIVRDHIRMNADTWGEDIFPFGIRVVMFALPPFRFVRHLGQYETGVERLQRERPRPIEGRCRAGSKFAQVTQVFVSSSFRHQTGYELPRPSRNQYDLDLGKLALKIFEAAFNSFIGIKRELPLLLSRLNRFFPIPPATQLWALPRPTRQPLRRYSRLHTKLLFHGSAGLS